MGERSTYTPPEIPGYRLVKEEGVDYSFDEEAHTIIFHYEKLPDPINPTTGNNIAPYFMAAGAFMATLGLIIYRHNVYSRNIWRKRL